MNVRNGLIYEVNLRNSLLKVLWVLKIYTWGVLINVFKKTTTGKKTNQNNKQKQTNQPKQKTMPNE